MPGKTAVRRTLRFGAGGALLVALIWGGYRLGYREGYRDSALPLPASAGQLYVVTYPVADLVNPVDGLNPSDGSPQKAGGSTGPPGPDFDPLIDLIVSTVEHDSWMESGTGEGEIQPFPTNGSLVVSQTRRVHEQLADLLAQLRALNLGVSVREIIPMLQSCAATRGAIASNPFTFRVFPASPKGRAAMQRIFNNSVQNMIAVWGEPEFSGVRGDNDFPAWATGQELAVWSRGAGQAYLAIQDQGESQQKLVAGWRSKD